MGRQFVLKPILADFAASVKSGINRTEVEGGLARYRKDQIGIVSAVNVTWRGNEGEYEYLRAFYRAATLNGSESFDIFLQITCTATTLYKGVYFIPGSFRLLGKSNKVYSVGAQLAVNLEMS